MNVMLFYVKGSVRTLDITLLLKKLCSSVITLFFEQQNSLFLEHSLFSVNVSILQNSSLVCVERIFIVLMSKKANSWK